MRLEPELWDALREICRRESTDIGTIVRQVEAQSRAGQIGNAGDGAGGRTSAVRVFIVQYFRTNGNAMKQDYAVARHPVAVMASTTSRV